MKAKLFFLIATFSLFILTGCSETKEDYVKDFGEFIEKVNKDSKDYSEDKWKKADAQFKEFSETKYKKYSSELTASELVEITKYKASYMTIRGVNSLKKVFGTDKE